MASMFSKTSGPLFLSAGLSWIQSECRSSMREYQLVPLQNLGPQHEFALLARHTPNFRQQGFAGKNGSRKTNVKRHQRPTHQMLALANHSKCRNAKRGKSMQNGSAETRFRSDFRVGMEWVGITHQSI